MDMMDGETEIRDYALERVIMLSDGVFGIAMTLLALDVRPPDHWDHTLAGMLNGMAIPFMAFFWSFFATASFWLTHRRLFGLYRRADGVISFLNLVLLGEIVLIPVATRVLTGMEYSVGSLEIYLGLFLLIGITNAVSWSYVAFLTDILRPPRRGPCTKLVVAAILMVLPVIMTALGVLSGAAGLHFLPVLMPVIAGAAAGARRLAAAIDSRFGPSPLPAPPVTGQVE